MLKAFKYRIYPNQEQKVLLAKHFGSVRWIYNWALDKKIKAYEEKKQHLTCFDISNEIPSLKKDENFLWLNEVNAQCLQMATRNLDNSFKKFFKEKSGFPKFKSKKAKRNSVQYPQNVKIDFGIAKIKLPKFKEGIKIKIDRKFEGKIKTVTISQAPSGKYFASILVDNGEELPIKRKIEENTTIGIDTGIKTFLTCSDGQTFENNKFLNKGLKKLARLNRAHSRKKKDSKNKEKARIKLARQHEKISNQRKDYIHKVTHKLTNDKQIGSICVETLDIVGMMKTKSLSRNLSDVGLGLFYTALAYKCEWRGVNLIKIGQFEPSSKTCGSCGEVNHNLTLADRNWTCICGVRHDRDLNAAKNIKTFGLAGSKDSDKPKLPMECRKVKPVETRVSGSMKQEIRPLVVG